MSINDFPNRFTNRTVSNITHALEHCLNGSTDYKHQTDLISNGTRSTVALDNLRNNASWTGLFGINTQYFGGIHPDSALFVQNYTIEYHGAHLKLIDILFYFYMSPNTAEHKTLECLYEEW